ncbi:MAG: MBOAT family protein [Alistipes sp.]|nr:MBOAT family protein [Alistipes sp.]
MMEALELLWQKVVALMTYDSSSPLIFSSGLFLFLFVGFLLLYRLLQRTTTARILYVVAFSLYFYYKSSGLYFLLLIVAATYDYMIGFSLYHTHNRMMRRLLVAMSVALNLGMLGYFKYTNFLIDISNQLFGEGFLQFQNIFLPVGISFFVFQSMSYTIDIYRRELRPLTSWLDYLFYLSFFPQLVAGPIVRAKDFIPQIRRRPMVTREMLGGAVFLILTGLFKKAVISDYIALNFVDRIFDEPLLYSGFECLMGLYGYALQIYCDFSGYSDMAIGLALMMGFHFPKNFDAPYQSATITEFWRRWHISLSSWLRDYLYISLGGNRKGKRRTYLNLLLTMLLGGLWHGAALRFVLWGALHGVALAVHKMWLEAVPWAKKDGTSMNPLSRLFGVVLTFHIVCLGWLVFRADSMQTAALLLHQIFTNFDTSLIPQIGEGYAFSMGLIALGYLLHFIPTRVDGWMRGLVSRAPMGVQVAMLVVVIWCVMQIKSADIQPFIYFQF